MRKLTAFVVLLVLSVVLVACAGEDEEPEPTAAATAPQSTRIVESTPAPAVDAAIDDEEATPEAATPAAVDDEATPGMVATPTVDVAATPVASPAVSRATPTISQVVQDITPVASPGATPVPSGLNEPPVRIELAGLVTLEGRENEAYILTDEGCVGLGAYSGLQAERQVVIRNENGTIVSVTSLDASDADEGCAWEFVAAVPESEFYSVSIPMVFEQVFPKAQVAEGNGSVTIEVP